MTHALVYSQGFEHRIIIQKALTHTHNLTHQPYTHTQNMHDSQTSRGGVRWTGGGERHGKEAAQGRNERNMDIYYPKDNAVSHGKVGDTAAANFKSAGVPASR